MAELLIGCGGKREKRLSRVGFEKWSDLTTLDINVAHDPDIVHNLERLPYPFSDDAFDEVHAYEVLEHTGRQGDWRFFFAQFSELWRILEPGGHLFATCPSQRSSWAWGDPGHTRIVSPQSLVFLCQPQYTAQVGVTPMTDYRDVYSADFDVVHSADEGSAFSFVLQAVKPSRIAG